MMDIMEKFSELDNILTKDPNNNDALLMRGQLYGSVGDYKSAINDYSQLIDLEPRSSTYRTVRALAYLHNGNYELANDDASIGISIDSSSVQLWVIKADCMAAQGDFESSIKNYSEAINRRPISSELYFSRGIAKKELEQWDGALVDFNSALRFSKRLNAQIQLNRGITYLNLKNFKHALDDLLIAVMHITGECAPEAYFYKGCAQQSLDMPHTALTSFDKCLELNPNCHNAYLNRGIVRRDLGRTEEALADVEHFYTLEPEESKCWDIYGSLLSKVGRVDESLKIFSNAIIKQPKNPIFYKKRAAIKIGLREFRGALQDCDALIELDHDLADAILMKGYAYDQLDEPDDAIKCCNDILSIDINHTLARSLLASVYDEMNEYEKSIEQFSALIMLDRDNVKAYSRRGYGYLSLGKFSEAEKDFLKIIDLEPKNWKGYNVMGLAYSQNKMCDNAIHFFEKAIELSDDSEISSTELARMHFHLGMMNKKSMRPEVSVKHFNTAIDLKSDDSVSYYQRAFVKAVLKDDDAASADIILGIGIDDNQDRASDLSRLIDPNMWEEIRDKLIK